MRYAMAVVCFVIAFACLWGMQQWVLSQIAVAARFYGPGLSGLIRSMSVGAWMSMAIYLGGAACFSWLGGRIIVVNYRPPA